MKREWRSGGAVDGGRGLSPPLQPQRRGRQQPAAGEEEEPRRRVQRNEEGAGGDEEEDIGCEAEALCV
jgi:hypothetical protein